ncbi:LAMI_0H16886g1_1 [Lachancea mirantina]|uniref:TBP-associated factor 12 n=1 Tax=Lachancea mirantina TaxID=1230905 RepID=A0A1G4KIZ6_9SACH|nr:LAMI_0H16886g1_1 [Lachancea mirantina]
MSANNSGNDSSIPVSAGSGQGHSNASGAQDPIQQLAIQLYQYTSQARRVGEDTPQGQELLKRAAKIKAVYDAYNGQKQQVAQNMAQTRVAGVGQAGSPNMPMQGRAASATNNITNNIQALLTPEQSEAHKRLIQSFNENGEKIKSEYAYLKRNIELLNAEIKKKQHDPLAVKQIETNKAELTSRIGEFNASFQALNQKLREDRKKFYIECAASNPNLKRYLQATTQQQRANTSSSATASPAVAATGPTSAVPAADQSSQNRSQNNGTPLQSVANSRSPSHVTPVNAAAHIASNANNGGRQTVFKQPNPSVAISETITQRMPSSVAYRSNRPTVTGGSAMNAASLNTPVMTKLPPYEVDSERVMSKRKLRELVKTVGIDEGDGETTIDGDVEELLLDLADDFITNVTSFACRLAKHRKSDNLDVRDIQLHLERNWNIRIPGYAADEVRSSRKWNPVPSYNQKLQSINSAKASKSANPAHGTAANLSSSSNAGERGGPGSGQSPK